MIDFDNLGQYRENNRIEAKQATGGLPESIWETYSAFANTDGGLILLGVIEREDKSLQAVELLDPEWLVEEFWTMVRDPRVASANILDPEDVWLQEVDGKAIVVIAVPQAKPEDRPVYVHGDPAGGVYRRCGEGDYRCRPGDLDSAI